MRSVPHHFALRCNNSPPQIRQRGVVLLIALIAVVLLLIAGLATLRSVDSTTMITGNLAFREGALQASDKGIEAARGALMQQSSPNWFFQNTTYDIPGQTCNPAGTNFGYFPIWDNSFDPKSEQFSTLRRCPSSSGTAGAPLTWANDSLTAPAPTDYTIRYVIHRLCEKPGDFTDLTAKTNCYVSGASIQSAGSQAGGGVGSNITASTLASAPYYRITARVEGPRNSVAYVQALLY